MRLFGIWNRGYWLVDTDGVRITASNPKVLIEYFRNTRFWEGDDWPEVICEIGADDNPILPVNSA